MKKIIIGKLYNTDTATIIASDRYWDGHNWDRNGRNKYLYKTKKYNYFIYYTSRWQGERDDIIALDKTEAKELYEELPEHEVDYEDAFDEEVEEA
jgi:hypothetical protein